MSWNIGNTTVRNPRRIRDGLRVFAAEFSGNLDGGLKESAFAWRLIANGVVDTSKKEGEKLDWHGRKWRSCFTKLGFATGKGYRRMGRIQVTLDDVRDAGLGLSGNAYELTPAGRRLVEADTEPAVADVFLRQLLRLEVTSPLEQEAASTQVKPLVLVLQTLRALENCGGQGLNRTEIAAFLQTAVNHDAHDVRVQRILDYRNERERKAGDVERRRFDVAAVEEEHRRAGLTGPRPESLVDYADTMLRYCRMTGLFATQGSRLKIRDETRILVDEILDAEPKFLASIDPAAYLRDFYAGTAIPTDDVATALRQIEVFESNLTKRGIEPTIRSLELVGRSSQDLALARHRIESQFLLAVEKEFADNHASDSAVVEEVLAYLRALSGSRDTELIVDDRPAYLEWSVWRALLILDSLAVEPHETRRFQLDSDMRPMGCAPGGGPDIIMKYEDFVVVAEVTMTGGSRQEAVEGEPVRRHVADVQLANQDKEVYCVFVAPTIDDNTAETFRIGVWWADRKPVYLNVVPLTLHQWVKIVSSISAHSKNTADLKGMLDRCLVFRNQHGPDWLQQIDSEIERWIIEK